MRKQLFIKGPHNILFVAGIVGLLFFLGALFNQLNFECDFSILSIETKCQQPLNNRCIYEYSVKSKSGLLSKIGLDGNLFVSEDLAVGKSIQKNKFSFVYQVDGKRTNWTFANYYLGIFFISILAFGLWRYLTFKAVLKEIK